jgi:hypothetical protein
MLTISCGRDGLGLGLKYVITVMVADVNKTLILTLTLTLTQGQTAVIKMLLAAVPPPDINHVNGYGNSALHVALRGGHFDVAEVLLLAGASVICENHKGSTPLHFLCYLSMVSEQSVILFQKLIDGGAYVNAVDHRLGLESVLEFK